MTQHASPRGEGAPVPADGRREGGHGAGDDGAALALASVIEAQVRAMRDVFARQLDLMGRVTTGEAVALDAGAVARGAVATPAPVREVEAGASPAAPGAEAAPILRGEPLDTGDATLPALFEAQAARIPDAPVMEAPDGTMTYGELDARSAAIAGALAARVPGRGARVAVCLERGCTMFAALLAVWRAGHVLVALDPSHPEARRLKVCEKAGVTAVISDDPALAQAAGATAIDPFAIGDAAPAAPPRAPEASESAYIVYTSGSTGEPKGVEVTHRSLVSFLQSMVLRPGLAEGEATLCVTTVTFDIVLLDLFAPLLVGGRCVALSDDEVKGGYAVAERVARGDIALLQGTPTLMTMLLEAGFEPRAGLRLLVGGEKMPPDLPPRLLAGGAELWNMYGPTETTVWCSCARVREGETITIGTPIHDMLLVVLDEQGRPATAGAEGELNIGGANLAVGYYGAPDLTAAAFREIEIEGRPVRLYATGDLARMEADGTLHLLGRRDGQIKLRGFRIELGEIEAAMRAQPGVARAAAMLRPGPSGDRIAGYVVPEDPAAPPEGRALAEGLSRTLPDYMVPTVWAVLDALPTTPSGKLDRKALPEPEGGAGADGGAPATETERRIASVWVAALGRMPDVTADIHESGIDSLSVFRLTARLADAGIRARAADLLEHRTIRALAAHHDAGGAPDAGGPSLRDFARGAAPGR